MATFPSELELSVRRAKLDPDQDSDEGYSLCIAAIARVVLEYTEQHPEDVGAPVEDVYDWDTIQAEWRKLNHQMFLEGGSGHPRGPEPDHGRQMRIMLEHRTSVGLYDRIREKDPERGKILAKLGLTGFQWGAGFNLAMQILNLPGQPNPAMVDVSSIVATNALFLEVEVGGVEVE